MAKICYEINNNEHCARKVGQRVTCTFTSTSGVQEVIFFTQLLNSHFKDGVRRLRLPL